MKPTYETKVISKANFMIKICVDYFNQRLRVDDYRGNVTQILQELEQLMHHYKFTKLIFYSRYEHWQQLLAKGFALEGVINGYFNGSDNYIMTSYQKDERRTSNSWLQEDTIIHKIQQKERKVDDSKSPDRYHFRKATVHDVNELAALYGKVFLIYPTPMNNPEYITKMLNGGTIFYVVECKNELVSAASADINQMFHNAELTDCATLPEHRKYHLMKNLLVQLEQELKDEGIYCAYSLARALSFGMNAVLYQLGYQYNGRLTNNCYIFDKLENMNVWVKDLSS